jgi:RNA-binding protein YlmH
MTKREKGCNTREDGLLEARVRDAFNAAASYGSKFIGFLDPHEALSAQKCVRLLCDGSGNDDCSYGFFGGYDGAERVFLGVFPPYSQPKNDDFPIAAVEITWRFASLAHRDFLGALLALGIMRGKIGDIVIGNEKCTVFAEKTVSSFIVQNLVKVGAAGVRCKTVNAGFAVREEHFKELNGTVASQRLDCVVSVLTGNSRSAAAELITGGLVSVDFETRCEISGGISEGATVSIRGHGRFIIDKLGPQTRKGRIAFAARKYL